MAFIALSEKYSPLKKWCRENWDFAVLMVVLSGLLGMYYTGIQSRKSENKIAHVENLSEKTFNAITGGDSLCYLDFNESNNDPDLFKVDITELGNYPLHNVKCYVQDLNRKGIDIPTKFQSLPLGEREQICIFFIIEHLYPSSLPTTIAYYPIKDRKEQNFHICFEGPRMRWWEDLNMRFIDGKWVHSIKITDVNMKVLFQK